ncbi:MAG: HEAT repeat domain-containing protein [Planctomycetota bacterium]|jgi:HEAT repeat protein
MKETGTGENKQVRPFTIVLVILLFATVGAALWLHLGPGRPDRSRSVTRARQRPRTIEGLVAQLGSEDGTLVAAAREELLGKSRRRVIAALIEVLTEDPRNTEAKRLLAEFGEPAIAPLVRMLTQTKPVVERWKEAAEDALSSGPAFGRDLDEFEMQRTAAAATLVAIGEDAVPVVIETLEKGSDPARPYAAKMLGMMDDERAVEPLIEALDDEVAAVVWNAAWALGKLHEARAYTPLVEAFNRIREEAGAARAAPPAGGPAPPPSDIVKNAPVIRATILDALCALGHPASARFIAKALEDEDKEVRLTAVRILSRVRVRPTLDQLDEPGSTDRTSRQIGREKVAASLASLLEDNDAEVSAAVALQLASLGDRRATATLLETLSSDYEDDIPTWSLDDEVFIDDIANTTRAEAARLLGKSGGEGVYEVLAAALDDDSMTIRIAAAKALSELGDARAVEPLIAIVTTGSKAIYGQDVEVCAVMKALGELRDARAVAPIVTMLSREDAYTAGAAAEALGAIGSTEAVKPLVKALGHDKESVRVKAAEALGRIRDAVAVAPLVAALADKEESVSDAAGQALIRIADQESVDLLRKALRSKSKTVRAAVAKALGATGDGQVLAPLTDCLADPEVSVRKAAVWGLRAIESDESNAILAGLLAVEDEEVRKSAVAALREIRDPSLVVHLEKVYRTGSVPARVAVAKVLGRVKGDEAVEFLAIAVRDEDPAVRRRAAWSLETQPGKRATDILLDAWPDKDPSVTVALAYALTLQEDPRASGTFVEMLESDDWGIRTAGVWGLGQLMDNRALSDVVRMLEDPSKAVRYVAAIVVGMLRDPAGVEPLLAGYDEKDATERAARAFALACIDSVEARSALREILKDVDVGDVRDNYHNYITQSRKENLVALLAVFGKWGDKDMAKDFFWANLSGLRTVARLWSIMHGCYNDVESSKDTPDRPKWRATRESVVDQRIWELKEGDAGQRAEAAYELGRHFQEYAPRPGVPMFEAGKVIVIKHFDPATEPPTDQDSWGIATDGSPADWGAFEREWSRQRYRDDQMEEAVQAVVAALDDAVVKVRVNAATALGHTCDPVAVEPLSRALKDREQAVREAAAVALGKIRTDAAAEALGGALKDPEPAVRSAAARSLGTQGRMRSMTVLINALEDGDESVRAAAVNGLEWLGEGSAIEALMELLRDDSAEVRARAASALRAIDDPRAVAPLVPLLKDERPCVRVAAAKALATIDTDKARAALDNAAGNADLRYILGLHEEHIRKGAESDEPLLILALGRYGGVSTATAYYWSGNDRLRDASLPILDWPDEEQAKTAYPDETPKAKWGVAKDAEDEKQSGAGDDSEGA